MSKTIYRQLCEALAQRGGPYAGKDIPEFYALVEELFTQDEAAVAAAMPRKPSPASIIAQVMDKNEKEVESTLENMANKGLCATFIRDGVRYYIASPFYPGIFEFQLMRGTTTERDRKIAKLIHDYKKAIDASDGMPQINFPVSRVVTVEKAIDAKSRVHTFDQVSYYIEKYDPIAVTTCYCRHEGKLVDEKDDCGKPDDVCMQFGVGAEFVIERGMGRKVTKEEAMATLKRAEEAGLVHMSNNTQDMEYICNCCPCHCVGLKMALAQPKPGRSLFSGFQPHIDADACVACEACIERCPATALIMGDNIPELNIDRCFGCGACATGCPVEAIKMVERIEAAEPPIDRKALAAAVKLATGKI